MANSNRTVKHVSLPREVARLVHTVGTSKVGSYVQQSRMISCPQLGLAGQSNLLRICAKVLSTRPLVAVTWPDRARCLKIYIDDLP